MARNFLRRYPDPVLRQKALPVGDIGDELAGLAARMLEIMEKHRGIGLAGNQVGELKRIVVIGRVPEILDEPLVLVNPEITSTAGRLTDEEGCLSFPGNFSAPVRRFREVKAEFRNLAGELMRIEAIGLFARVLQHEIDHLDGIVYPDRLSLLARRRFLRGYLAGCRKKPAGGAVGAEN